MERRKMLILFQKSQFPSPRLGQRNQKVEGLEKVWNWYIFLWLDLCHSLWSLLWPLYLKQYSIISQLEFNKSGHSDCFKSWNICRNGDKSSWIFLSCTKKLNLLVLWIVAHGAFFLSSITACISFSLHKGTPGIIKESSADAHGKARKQGKKDSKNNPIPDKVVKEISELLQITKATDESAKIAEEVKKRKKSKKGCWF